MSYLLYPRLRKIDAEEIAKKVSSIPPKAMFTAFDFDSVMDNQAVYFSPTGTTAQKQHLIKIREEILTIASVSGFPEKNPDEKTRMEFDSTISEYLLENLDVHPSEASNIEIWFFMTCLLLPDIVRWRFYDSDNTSIERYLGSDRGIRRNTFGRLWWRAYLLLDTNSTRNLLVELNEDELVQITERPSLSNNQRIAKYLGEFYLTFLETNKQISEFSRREILRDAIKRIRRFTSFTSLNLLENSDLENIFSRAFEETAFYLAQDENS